MAFRDVLVLSDNAWILDQFTALIRARTGLQSQRSFKFACSPASPALIGKDSDGYTIEPLDIRQGSARVVAEHDLIISAHCKQLFPAPLVNARRCINIHPGLNPYNRGWFPQVFSILNGLPLGATIHEIDEQLDHGNIIDQMEVPVYPWDTSLDAYDRVQAAEMELLDRSIDSILNGTYVARPPGGEGNVNCKKDFSALCRIDPNEHVTFKHAIDRLRALTHGTFNNAYFVDPATGKKIYVRIALQPED